MRSLNCIFCKIVNFSGTCSMQFDRIGSGHDHLSLSLQQKAISKALAGRLKRVCYVSTRSKHEATTLQRRSKYVARVDLALEKLRYAHHHISWGSREDPGIIIPCNPMLFIQNIINVDAKPKFIYRVICCHVNGGVGRKLQAK